MVPRRITTTPPSDLISSQEIPGPLGSGGLDMDELRLQARSAFSSIDRGLPPAERLEALTRRLHGLRLTKHHWGSGISMTMSLDYTLSDVEVPIELRADQDFVFASEILSLVASALHKAVSKANLAIAGDIVAALGSDDV